MRGHRDLLVLVAVAVVCALGTLIAPVEALALVFAVPLALFLPGYAIALAALARRDIEGLQMALIGVGLSLTVLVLGALLLNFVPGGLSWGSWALLLVLTTIAASRAAAIRRLPADAAGRSGFRLQRPAAPAVAALVLAFLIASAAVALAFVPVSADHAVGYSELSIQPYQEGSSSGVEVGVGSNEQETAEFDLVVSVAGGGPHRTHLSLEPGQTATARVPRAAGESGRTAASATLYRTREPGRPYRQVSTWIPPAPVGAEE